MVLAKAGRQCHRKQTPSCCPPSPIPLRCAQPNKLTPMRIIAILSYFLIFLQGSMILVPFGVLLLFGLFNGEPFMRYLILLADLSLVALLFFSFKPNTKAKFAVEIVSYFILLLPLARTFLSFPFEQFNYFLFIFPTLLFVILFPLSIYFSYKRNGEDIL
jgi:hypothetical protein